MKKFIKLFDEASQYQYLVNMAQIVDINLETNEVVLADKRMLILERSEMDKLKEALGEDDDIHESMSQDIKYPFGFQCCTLW